MNMIHACLRTLRLRYPTQHTTRVSCCWRWTDGIGVGASLDAPVVPLDLVVGSLEVRDEVTEPTLESIDLGHRRVAQLPTEDIRIDADPLGIGRLGDGDELAPLPPPRGAAAPT